MMTASMYKVVREPLEACLGFCIVFAVSLLLNGRLLYFIVLDKLGMESQAIYMAAFFLVPTILVFFLACFQKKGRFSLNIVDIGVLFLYIYLIARFLLNINEETGYLAASYLIFGPAAYFLGRSLDRKYYNSLLWIIVAIGVVEVVASIEVLVRYNFIFTHNRFSIEASHNPILMGRTFSILAVASILYIYYQRNKSQNSGSKIKIGLLVLIAIAAIFLMLLSASKQTLIGLILVLFFLFVKYPFRHKMKYLFLLVVPAMVMYIFIGFYEASSLHQSLVNIVDNPSTKARIDVMSAAWGTFSNAPIFGIGPGVVVWAHNIFLDTAAILGIFGFLLILLIVAVPFIKLLRKKYLYHRGVDAGFLFICSLYILSLTSVMVSGQLRDSFDFFLASGLLVTAYRKYNLSSRGKHEDYT